MESVFYKEILGKLDNLNKRECLFKILKGFIVSVAFSAGLFFTFTVLEMLFYFSSTVRTVLFFIFILSSLGVFVSLALLPLLKLFGIFSTTNYQLLAGKVGNYFPSLKDDLLNSLQIINFNPDQTYYSTSLIDAAFKNIYSRSQSIEFESIVDFSWVKKSSVYLFASLIFISVILFVFPGLNAASTRLVNFNNEFIPPQEFYFDVKPGNIEVTKGEEVEISIGITGKVPSKIYLAYKSEAETDFQNVQLSADSAGNFKYKTGQLRDSFLYYAFAENISSENYEIKVIDRPVIRSFDIKIISPSYSGIPIQNQKDNGNITALIGSNVQISLLANKEMGSATIEFSDSLRIPLKIEGSIASGSFKIKKDDSYKIIIADKRNTKGEQPVEYSIKALTDSYPVIELNYPKENVDLPNDNRLPLQVKLYDDYGFSKLELNYKLSASKYEPPAKAFTKMEIAINKSLNEQIVDYIWNLTQLSPAVSDIFSIYLEVFDNDIISGPKSAKTQVISVRVPSLDEILARTDEVQESVQDQLEETFKEANELKENLEKLQQELKKDQQQITWEEKEKLEQALDKFEQLQEKMESIQDNLKQVQNELQQNDLLSKETLEKYMELQKLMDELTGDEMKKAMEQLQQMLQKMNRNMTQDALENMKLNEERFQKSIERTMNLLKRIQIEQKMDELVKRTENILEKQDQLKEQTQQSDLSDKEYADNLSQKQDEIQKELDRLEEKMQELKQKMSEVEKMPVEEMEKLNQEFEEQNNQELSENASQQMQQNNKQQATQKQQKISENMKQMSASMQQMQQMMMQENQMQTFTDMMKLLDNLLELSKQQEELKNSTQNLDMSSPQMNENAQKQNEIRKNLNRTVEQMAELSQKTFAISPEMGKALGTANQKMQQSLQSLQNRNGSMSVLSQSDAMASLNEAASMMKNSLESMMQGGGSGGGMMSLMQQLQQLSGQQMNLNNLTQMLQQMQKGGLSSQQQAELQRLAQQQELIKKSLEQLNNEAKSSGESSKIPADLEQLQNQMREVISDMNTQKLDDELVQKQERILSKLLDAQKSINERDFEKERKSETGQNVSRLSPADLNLNSQEARDKLKDALNRAIQEGFSKDYEELIRKYFEAIQSKQMNN